MPIYKFVVKIIFLSTFFFLLSSFFFAIAVSAQTFTCTSGTGDPNNNCYVDPNNQGCGAYPAPGSAEQNFCNSFNSNEANCNNANGYCLTCNAPYTCVEGSSCPYSSPVTIPGRCVSPSQTCCQLTILPSPTTTACYACPPGGGSCHSSPVPANGNCNPYWNDRVACNQQCINNSYPSFTCDPNGVPRCRPAANGEFTGTDAGSNCLASCEVPILTPEPTPWTVPVSSPDVPAFPEPIVPCIEDNATGYRVPEFHSLRPYQASPCGDAPVVYFCNNDYIIEEEVSTPFNFARCSQSGGSWVCTLEPNCGGTYIIDGCEGRDYWISVHEADFPILGNTQNVLNSQQSDEQINEAQKVNEYVNWYLQGITDKAEYGNELPENFVSFAGPVKKLMPLDYLNYMKLNVLHDAGVKEWFTFDPTEYGGSMPIDPVTGMVRETKNHNQIAVCDRNGGPAPCWPSGSGGNRLMKWWDARSSVPTDMWWNPRFTNWDGSVPWGEATPPFPWLFRRQIYYQKAFNEWMGQSCTILFNNLLCTGILSERSQLSEFYHFVPLGNSIDKSKKHVIGGVGVRTQGLTIAEVLSYLIVEEPKLYYPHTESTMQVSKELNMVHTPLQCDEDGNCDYIKGSGTNYEPTSCVFTDVRTNLGDDLTFSSPESYLEVDPVITQVTQVECSNSGYITNWLSDCDNQVQNVCDTDRCGPSSNNCLSCSYLYPGKCTTWPTCEAVVYIEIRTSPKIPYGDDLWKSTVVGKTSPFRKIFPKLMEGAPVQCIKEIPGVTKDTYTTNEETNLIRIQGPEGHTYGGAGANATSQGELFFPHQGTILEYFLHGIQTALRPLGYGSPITNGEACSDTPVVSCLDIEIPDSMVPAKYLGEYKENFIRMADDWPFKCKGPENNLAEECYNYVVSTAQASGVNPAFTLAIWLNESGASNYCFGGPSTQDLGINIESIYMNLVKQLERFIMMAKMKLCSGQSGWTENMHGWLSRFQSSAGVCNPNDQTATDYYYNIMNGAWTFLAPQCITTESDGSKRFGLDWPTDMSCP